MTEYPPQLPHGEIDEVFADIYFVSGESRPSFGGHTLQFSRNMTIIRDGNNLTLVNTLRLDDNGLAQLDRLGAVKNIVKLGSFHGRDDAFYLNRYEATLWAPADMDHERGVKTGADLVPGQPGPCPDASVFAFETSSVPEVILCLERQGGILVSCDSLQNWTGPDEYFDEASSVMMEKQGFFQPANVGPGWRNSAKPERSDFVRLIDLKFRHLLSAHGNPLLDEAHQAVSATVSKLYPA